METPHRLAHFSDLHFASWDWKLSQLFSKRWLGNLNFLFGRRSHFDHARLEPLPSLLKRQKVSTVLITGDLSTTSAPAEFQKARAFIDLLEKEGLEVFCVPGNHDHYTKKAYKERHFYRYFPSHWDSTYSTNLQEHGLSVKKLAPHWWLVGLDTALATSWFQSTGYFHPATEKALEELLQSLPKEDSILLMNHFPFSRHESPRKQLVRGETLEQLLEKFPQIKIYCHGHTHRQCRANLRPSGLPLVLDSGSTPHRSKGGWHLIDLYQDRVHVEFYEWKRSAWTSELKVSYDLV